MPTMAELADSILLVTGSVPAGQVTTYGDVARVVGCGPRLVARVLAARGGETCWWRVLRSDGTIAEHLVGSASEHLAEEGVAVRAGRVQLSAHRAALE